MDGKLRKKHKVSWLLMVIILPILLVFIIKDLPLFTIQNQQEQVSQPTTTQALQSAENDLLKISLIKEGGSPSLEIIVKAPLKTASSLVYTIGEDNKKGLLLGQVTAVGIYTFQAPEDIKGVLVHDAIKDTDITKITF